MEQIFEETGASRMDSVTRVVQEIVAEAGSTTSVRLLEPLKRWQQKIYGWSSQKFYGEALARVVYISDFAVWIPWVMRLKPSAENKRLAALGIVE